MPFDPADPRTTLAVAAPINGMPRPAQYVEFGSTPPDEISPLGSCTWWVRSQAAVLAYSQVRPGETMSLATGAESAVLIPYAMTATLSADESTADVTEPTVAFLPAGHNVTKAHSKGIVVRVFAAAAEPGLAARCRNAAAYTGKAITSITCARRGRLTRPPGRMTSINTAPARRSRSFRHQ